MFRAEGAGLITASGNTILNANQWYHVVGTYDGNNTRFYLNGVEDATPASGSGNMTNNSANLEIGRRDDGYYFPGKIDDVRIYNRALSGDEIKRLYRIGATLKINTSINNDSLANGLVGYWSMNAPDVAGTTAYDRSGNSKNGSFLGQDISPSGLVGWWKLDEGSGTSAGDSSGQGNTGTLAASPGTPTWTTGKIGQGLSFDGSDDYVSVANLSSQIVNSNISIAEWVKPVNNPSSYDGYFGFRNGDTDDSFYILQLSGTNSLECRFRNSAGTVWETTTPTVTPSVWNHVALT